MTMVWLGGEEEEPGNVVELCLVGEPGMLGVEPTDVWTEDEREEEEEETRDSLRVRGSRMRIWRGDVGWGSMVEGQVTGRIWRVLAGCGT